MTKMVAATFTVMYPPQKNIYGGSVVVYDGRLITELLVVQEKQTAQGLNLGHCYDKAAHYSQCYQFKRVSYRQLYIRYRTVQSTQALAGSLCFIFLAIYSVVCHCFLFGSTIHVLWVKIHVKLFASQWPACIPNPWYVVTMKPHSLSLSL